MVARALVAVILLGLVVRPAAADDNLADARAAIEAVRYDRARSLLVAALQAGDNSPERVVEIYRLSANTATVLGDRDVAEQYYRRWLALDPTASLPASVAPKLRQPFVAAQAYMAAHGRLVANARASASGIVVTIDSDPLAMVAGVVDGEGNRARLGADHAVTLASTSNLIELTDEFGNRLLAVDVTKPTDVAPPPAPPPAMAHTAPSDADDGSPSLFRRPITWAVPAVVFAATGVAFAFAARSADHDVQDILAHSTSHFASDLDAARSRRDRDALLANLGFGLGGAFAIAAVATYLVRPQPTQTALLPTSHGIALSGSW